MVKLLVAFLGSILFLGFLLGVGILAKLYPEAFSVVVVLIIFSLAFATIYESMK